MKRQEVEKEKAAGDAAMFASIPHFYFADVSHNLTKVQINIVLTSTDGESSPCATERYRE
jgi:hypothetical protein